ncbi:MAG: glycosyltransferase family 9 protein [Pusillimonas sp.]
MAEFPLHFHWLVNDLHICAGPPANGQRWCLDVDVWRPSTGEVERMLWDANIPWGLVRRDPRSSTIMSVLPGARQRDLLVVAEQGIGDIVQQLRYVPPVAAHFNRTRIQCKPELHRFIRRQGHGIEPVTARQVLADPPKVRAQLMRMGALCSDPSHGNAYLTAQACRGARQARGLHGGLRVGLNWSASKVGVARDIKSIPLVLLERLLVDHPEISWVSVQWGGEEACLMRQHWAAAVEPCGHAIHDVADLADAIAGLDLLISIDSAPAHLAGALGVPVWTLLTRPCSWRWGLDSPHTGLYRSMRLFRQPALNAWTEVLAQVSGALDTASLPMVGPGGPAMSVRMPERADHVACLPTPAANHPGQASLAHALALCRKNPRMRAAFVAQPLAFLSAQGIGLQHRDYRSLNQIFKAMVDFHDGFSWCWPLKPLQSSSFNSTVIS